MDFMTQKTITVTALPTKTGEAEAKRLGVGEITTPNKNE